MCHLALQLTFVHWTYLNFDKMNHDGLFVKLMDRNIRINLLMLFEHWFSVGVTCVKWGSIVSRFIGLLSGIGQGGVLSPHFFAIYTVNHKKTWQYIFDYNFG